MLFIVFKDTKLPWCWVTGKYCCAYVKREGQCVDTYYSACPCEQRTTQTLQCATLFTENLM